MPVVSSLIRWVALMLLLGAASGIAWLKLAEPAKYLVTDQGTILDEQASKGRFGVVVTFLVIGIVVSFVWGALAGLRLREHGWVLVPVFAIAAFAAGVLAWRIGVVFGPPDPATVTGVKLGGVIPERLAVDSFPPFLAWPILALVGLFAALASTGDRGHDPARHSDEVIGG